NQHLAVLAWGVPGGLMPFTEVTKITLEAAEAVELHIGIALPPGSYLGTKTRTRVSHYSITSAARASNAGGIVRSIAFAVLALMFSSNLVAACTGRLAGFSPLRMRCTYSAARWYGSIVSGP